MERGSGVDGTKPKVLLEIESSFRHSARKTTA